MKIRQRLIIMSVMCLFAIGGYALPLPKIIQITVDNGLINGNIHQIVQDKEGFIWIATENGLVRYDGFSYKNFQTKQNDRHCISHNFVNSVNTCDGVSIWIGTMSGLDCYNPISGEFEHYHFYNANGNATMKPALRVLPTSDGCYVQSDDKQVYYATIGCDTLRVVPTTALHLNAFVSAMDMIYSERLLVGNKDGQVYVLGKDGAATFLEKRESAVTSIKHIGNELFCVCFADGTIDIFNKDELQSTYHMPKLDDAYVNDVVAISDSVVWLGMRSLGIYEFHVNGVIRPLDINKMVNKNCNSLYKDTFGNVWIGHSFGGITLRLAQIYDLDDEGIFSDIVLNQKVLAVERTENKLYVGTDGGGLYVCNEKTKGVKHYNYSAGIQGNVFDDVVTAICQDDEYVWIGTYKNGLFALSKRTDALVFHSQLSKISAKDISALYADSQRNLWIGTYENGVFVFNKDSGKVVRHYTGYEDDGFLTISCNGTTCFFEDSEHFIWIGSYYGISKIAPNGDSKIYRFEQYPGMRSSVVTTVAQTIDGTVWFGSLQGLSYYDQKKDTIVELKNVQAANTGAICEIVPQADSSMLVVTPKYLYSYTLEGNDFHLLTSLDKGEFRRNAYYVSRQELLLGTDNGLKSISFPLSIPNEMLHTLRLTDILVHGESIFSPRYSYEVKHENGVYYMELPYTAKDVALRFSDFYFDKAYPSDYLYCLKGLNRGWTLLHDDNEVVYTDLKGGDYVFYAKHLTNSDKAEIELHIHIKKAFWEQTWFYVLLISSVIAAICYVFIRRMRRMIRIRNILRKQVDLRMQDIKRKTEQIELQNVQMKLQRDAATRQRSEAEQKRAGLEKRLSILLGKLQKSEDLMQDLKKRTVLLNKDKLLLKRRVDLYENTVHDVVFKVLLPSEKIEYVSPSVVQLTGYDDTEFMEGQVSFKTILPSEVKKDFKKHRNMVLEGKMPEVVEFCIKDKDGVMKRVRQYSRYETNLKGTVIALEILLVFLTEERSDVQNNEVAHVNDRMAEKDYVDDTSTVEYDWQGKTILVGDFDDKSFAFIQESLLPTKIEIVRAIDGEDVLRKYAENKNKISVVLLDMQLPLLNGYEVAIAIRKQDKVVPIIAQTMYGSYDAKLQCFDAGCDTYISKPYKISDLQSILLKCFNK